MTEAEAAIKAFLKLRMYRHERVMRVMRDAEQLVFDLFAIGGDGRFGFLKVGVGVTHAAVDLFAAHH